MRSSLTYARRFLVCMEFSFKIEEAPPFKSYLNQRNTDQHRTHRWNFVNVRKNNSRRRKTEIGNDKKEPQTHIERHITSIFKSICVRLLFACVMYILRLNYRHHHDKTTNLQCCRAIQFKFTLTCTDWRNKTKNKGNCCRYQKWARMIRI